MQLHRRAGGCKSLASVCGAYVDAGGSYHLCQQMKFAHMHMNVYVHECTRLIELLEPCCIVPPAILQCLGMKLDFYPEHTASHSNQWPSLCLQRVYQFGRRSRFVKRCFVSLSTEESASSFSLVSMQASVVIDDFCFFLRQLKAWRSSSGESPHILQMQRARQKWRQQCCS